MPDLSTSERERDLTLHQMRCFLAITEAGGVSRAAARLGLTQSAISRILAQIEGRLGASLAERTHHGLRLTEQGQVLQRACREMLQHHAAMRSEIDALSGAVRGACRVAMPESVGRVLFLPLVQSIRAEHPAATLRVMPAFSSAMPEMLLSGQLDVAIVTDTHSHAGLDTEPLAEEAFVFVARPDDPAAKTGQITLAALNELPLILTAWSGGIRAPIDAAFRTAGTEPSIRLEIDSNSTILDLVLAGEGYAILPYAALHREAESGILRAVEITDPVIKRRLYLATPANRPVSAISRQVLRQISVLSGRCASQAGWSVRRDTDA